MCESISNVPVKWKPKMKLKCHECHTISKMVVRKIYHDKYNANFKPECKACGEEYCVTEDLLREMSEDALGGKK